ncbi:MAG: glycosyltransferase involved in cell wall biosynthesis, partial [Limisphaerales bacterium]
FSTDTTPQICADKGVVFKQHSFLGYGRQKQRALEHTTSDWVLFLDADEMLSDELIQEIKSLRERGFGADGHTGFSIPRNEQVFWRMSADGTRKNLYVRLFNRKHARFTEMPIHATVDVSGKIGDLTAPFYHFGETDIHTKVHKVNSYSTGLVRDKIAKGRRPNPWIMVVYPPFFFIRSYVFKRGFLNGWAGFVASVVGSFYAFLKYAKLYEHSRFKNGIKQNLPDRAPLLKTPAERFNSPV